jgi:heterodisulfide reductase subunit B
MPLDVDNSHSDGLTSDGNNPTGAALVIGGGIAGMQASLDLANTGYKVYMVEKNSAIGGNMARLVKSLGAETVDWSRKTECCGGSLAMSKTEAAAKLMRRVMDDARACGAEAIVTMCPICHLNLDSRQAAMGYSEAEEIPIFQATQLMSLAFGLGEDKAAINNNLIDPKPFLKDKGVFY